MGTPRAARCPSSSRAICTYCVNTSTLAPSARMVSSSSSSSSTFPERPAIRTAPAARPPSARPFSFRYCAGWLQICLSEVSSLTTSPRRANPVGPGDLVEPLAHHGLVQPGLLLGQRHRTVGLRLGRQLRRDPRIGLTAAQQERPHQPGQSLGRRARLGGRRRAALDGLRIARTEPAQRPQQPRRRPVQDRPQLRQVVLHRGAGQCHPGLGGEGPQRPGGRGERILDVLCLVGDDQPPAHLRQLPGIEPHRPVGGEHELAVRQLRPGCAARPWKRRTGVPGANFSISRCQLPMREVGQTTSVGPADPGRSAGADAGR